MLRSFARRWEQSAQACQLVPFDRFITGRIPTIEQYPFPYIAVIPGGAFRHYRTDRAEGSRRVFTVHIWVDVAKLEEGEDIAEFVRQLYANEAWLYDYGQVIDVLDSGPATARQVNESSYQCWELIKTFTLCLQQPRLDVSCEEGCGGSAVPSVSSSHIPPSSESQASQ
jgi:hypothetical protein